MLPYHRSRTHTRSRRVYTGNPVSVRLYQQIATSTSHGHKFAWSRCFQVAGTTITHFDLIDQCLMIWYTWIGAKPFCEQSSLQCPIAPTQDTMNMKKQQTRRQPSTIQCHQHYGLSKNISLASVHDGKVTSESFGKCTVPSIPGLCEWHRAPWTTPAQHATAWESAHRSPAHTACDGNTVRTSVCVSGRVTKEAHLHSDFCRHTWVTWYKLYPRWALQAISTCIPPPLPLRFGACCTQTHILTENVGMLADGRLAWTVAQQTTLDTSSCRDSVCRRAPTVSEGTSSLWTQTQRSDIYACVCNRCYTTTIPLTFSLASFFIPTITFFTFIKIWKKLQHCSLSKKSFCTPHVCVYAWKDLCIRRCAHCPYLTFLAHLNTWRPNKSSHKIWQRCEWDWKRLLLRNIAVHNEMKPQNNR